ncbi:SH3 domain-binding protein 5 [Dissostichus eleginoides]|uniref:SH3 domain-binding protein 5 n=1 Tax=Dissostichus eleginoides TaxID=100907 RepID=A0AAD9BAE2_DISEL|nr:SH3 domain-binding protein 5 [Dissostichus eleginoides]
MSRGGRSRSKNPGEGELEKLNQSTDDINRWESELEDCRQRFRAVLVEATVKLDEQVKKIGRAVDDSKPYWEARKVARQAQVEAQKATQEFQRAVEFLRAAKETIALAEERLLEEDSRQFDSAWQEMLNHATQRVMGAEQERTRSEAEHKKTAANYNSCITHMKQLEKKLKRSINKSRSQFKGHVDERQAKLVVAKSDYRAALRSLESISEEIHAQRRSLAIGTREQGVGAEVDGGHEDIANFKMESDGLSNGLDLAIPCSSNDPDSAWGSGHASPLLGPRSQCSGASSPDCDQERGERAEGAEATLEAGLNKLTLTVAQKQEEGDTGEEQEPHLMNPEISSPSSVLLLNSV